LSDTLKSCPTPFVKPTLQRGFECDSADRIQDDVRTGAAGCLPRGVR
jgi:hypothetical protein